MMDRSATAVLVGVLVFVAACAVMIVVLSLTDEPGGCTAPPPTTVGPWVNPYRTETTR